MANFKPISGAFTFGETAMPSLTVPEGTTQSFKLGAIVIASSGLGVKGGADPAKETILGIAEGPASGLTGAAVRLTPALPHVVFEATLDIAAGTHALVAGNLGARYGIGLDATSGHFFVDVAETSATRVAVVGFKDSVGTVSARVYVVFLPAATVYGAVAG